MSLPHVVARYTGGIFSAQSSEFELLGMTSFLENQAKFFGGGISLTDPVQVNIVDATFKSNIGTSGGAASLTSTESTSGGFDQCRFDSNHASNGGALYLSTGAPDATEGSRFVRDSIFHNNIAGESQ